MDIEKLTLLKKSFDLQLMDATKTNITKLITPIIGSPTKAEKFSSEILEEVKSDKFITLLDDTIGAVKKDETEEEFVARSKEVMKNLLLKKFK